MSAPLPTSEIQSFYAKILDDLNNLVLKQADSSEETDFSNELTELRCSTCGCLGNKTDDSKIEIATEDAEAANKSDIKPQAVKNEMTNKFFTDLNANDVSIELVESIPKLIAELSKNEECREALVDQNLFPVLTKCLKHPELNDSARIQLCRAMGNLCYYNDKARADFLACGLSDFFNLCKYCASLDFTNSSDEEKKQKNTMITVVIGCLHNLTNENDSLRKAVYELNVMELLKDFIPFIRNSHILIHYGSCLENLLELDEGKEQFVNEKLMLKLYEFMDAEFLSSLDDNTEDFFTTLNFLNELKMSKSYLCQTNFIEKAIELMENNYMNNSDDLLRCLSLFLVSMIVKEEKPDELFAYKDQLLLNKAINWICEDLKNEQLYIASAVIIANYLRSDDSVQKLLIDKREPHVKILNLLKSYHSVENQTLQHINLIHSFLGALRNFCVSQATRGDLLKQPLIETVLPFTNYENLEVKAKAISIIRLLIKSCTVETGLDLVFADNALSSLEKTALETSEHPGLIGESTRLVCYLPIAGKSEKNITKLGQYKFIEVIAKQLKCEHFIMVNEALLALNVLITINYGVFSDQLKASQFHDNFKSLLVKETMPIEMRLNALKLLKFLVDKNNFFTEDELKEYLIQLKALKTANSSNPVVVSCLTQLIDHLENLTA